MKAKSLLDQWVDLKEDFPRHIVLIQCGVFYETYQDHAEFLSEILNIKTFLRGTSKVAGFPIKSIQKYRSNIEGLGYKMPIENVGNLALNIETAALTGGATAAGEALVTGGFTGLLGADEAPSR